MTNDADAPRLRQFRAYSKAVSAAAICLATGLGTVVVSPPALAYDSPTFDSISDTVPPGTRVADDVDLSEPVVLSNGETIVLGEPTEPSPIQTLAATSFTFGVMGTSWQQFQWTTGSYWGLNDEVIKTYAYRATEGSNQSGCVHGLGYDPNNNWKATWYSSGSSCGQSGTIRAHWGNTIAVPKIRAKSTIIVTLFAGMWS
jgi:hypothetical protein